MDKFYVSSEVLNIFFNKDVFKHRLAIRMFIYIRYCKNGRLKGTKDLTTFFSSSKQSVQKALKWLEEQNFIIVSGKNNEWVSVLGKKAFKNKFSPKTLNTVSFPFIKDDLKNVKVFNSKVFKYNAQIIAITYGQFNIELNRVSLNQKVIEKSKIKFLSLQEDDRIGDSITEFNSKRSSNTVKPKICNQKHILSRTYLGKLLNRKNVTIQKNLQRIKIFEGDYFAVDFSNVKLPPLCRLPFEEAILSDFNKKLSLSFLTISGFKHEDKNAVLSELQASTSIEGAKEIILNWKNSDEDWMRNAIKNCFIKKTNNSYCIVKYRASTYTFNSDFKVIKSWRNKLNSYCIKKEPINP